MSGPGLGQEEYQSSKDDRNKSSVDNDSDNNSDGTGALRGHTFTVVGLGEHYTDYADKIIALHNHLHATRPSAPSPSPAATAAPALDPSTAPAPTIDPGLSPAYLHPDDDVVVIVDAYDVLLLPAIRMAPEFLASSSAPLVFCAENGGYPEFAFASLYQVDC